ncbi:MAG: Heat shock protein GrpE [Firmicutes bacterium]|nr:Heat shock protein GrpE [Bacillota bacterium]MDI6704784.1 nucleotide exchange factor GrpE [Bacillota bacterium]
MKDNSTDNKYTETDDEIKCTDNPEEQDSSAQIPGCGGEDGEAERTALELEEYKKKSEDYYDKLLRLQADFDNYRKRTAREKEEIYSQISGEIITQFLGVLDNMERALNAVSTENDPDCEPVRQGIRMVMQQLSEILSKYEVSEIAALGEKFDPNRHHAVMQAEGTGAEEGTVVEVLQKGYVQKNRVLRPSMVKVAK